MVKTHRSRFWTLCIVVAAIASFVGAHECAALIEGAGEFGESVGGLRIKLQLAGPMDGGKSLSHCAVVIKNVGTPI